MCAAAPNSTTKAPADWYKVMQNAELLSVFGGASGATILFVRKDGSFQIPVSAQRQSEFRETLRGMNASEDFQAHTA